jgi:hypothetical protein
MYIYRDNLSIEGVGQITDYPSSFRGEFAQYLERQQQRRAPYLFESNRY